MAEWYALLCLISWQCMPLCSYDALPEHGFDEAERAKVGFIDGGEGGSEGGIEAGTTQAGINRGSTQLQR